MTNSTAAQKARAERFFELVSAGKTVFAKSSSGWDIIGPAADLVEGKPVTVTRQSGDTTTVTVGHIWVSEVRNGLAYTIAAAMPYTPEPAPARATAPRPVVIPTTRHGAFKAVHELRTRISTGDEYREARRDESNPMRKGFDRCDHFGAVLGQLSRACDAFDRWGKLEDRELREAREGLEDLERVTGRLLAMPLTDADKALISAIHDRYAADVRAMLEKVQ